MAQHSRHGSGTTISFGTATAWLTSSHYYQSLPLIAQIIKLLWLEIVRQGKATVGTVSGTSITFGSAVAFMGLARNC